MLALLLIVALGGSLALAQERAATGGDVLLTFDTEFENDADAIVELGLDVPATYFWTGSYAQEHPEVLRKLAEQGNTIGSHSFHHDDLTKINPRQVQLDLQLARLVLEQIARVPVRAFRAPYLQYSDAVMAEVARLGHVIDSSDKSPWPRNRQVLEVAVSEFENLLVSDYDLFEGRRLDEGTARDFLYRAYVQHAADGRPLVVLMHPRIIGRHAGVLRDFIERVHQSGGRFLTLDGYLEEISRPKVQRQHAVWLDLAPGATAADLAAVAAAQKASDVILSLQDLTAQSALGPTRAAAAVAGLQARGIRVHLAFPVGHHPVLARTLPDGAMTDSAGGRSAEWVSPSHPEIRRRLVQDARTVVARLGVDGLHLYGLGYPGLTWDFSPAALHQFSADQGVANVAPDDILERFYLIWTQWRAREVASLVLEIAAAARSAAPAIAIGLSVDAGSATDYRTQEWTGQDLRLLGGLVDSVVLWPPQPGPLGQPAPGQIRLAARTQTGKTPLLIGTRPGTGASLPGLGAPKPDGLALRLAIALNGGGVVDLRTGTDRPCCASWLMAGVSAALGEVVP
jgi:peptidoglycan/xylan/chitin deacetylase (PgdA/CDA1 family)